MATFVTADLHFGHVNVLTYCNRPFNDVQHMNEMLVNNWNETVDTDDTVWVLGDVAMGRIEDSLAFVRRLNGHKILVAGNHDRVWIGNSNNASKQKRWMDAYTDAGFEKIFVGEETVRLTLPSGREVRAGHFPPTGDSRHEDRYKEWRPADDGEWFIHGHVHDEWLINNNFVNIGMDVWNYRPVDFVRLEEFIDGREAAS